MALYGCRFHFLLGASNASCLLWHIWKSTLLFVLKLATDWFDNHAKFFLFLSVFSPSNSTHLSMAVKECNASCCAALAEVWVKYQFICPEIAMKHSVWFLYVVFLNSHNCNYSILPTFLTFIVFFRAVLDTYAFSLLRIPCPNICTEMQITGNREVSLNPLSIINLYSVLKKLNLRNNQNHVI